MAPVGLVLCVPVLSAGQCSLFWRVPRSPAVIPHLRMAIFGPMRSHFPLSFVFQKAMLAMYFGGRPVGEFRWRHTEFSGNVCSSCQNHEVLLDGASLFGCRVPVGLIAYALDSRSHQPPAMALHGVNRHPTPALGKCDFGRLWL